VGSNPFDQIRAFMDELRARDGISASALEFTILTTARTGESLGARWSEIDVVTGTWNIPASRMKARRPHRVPLSSAALAVVEQMKELRQSDLVFPAPTSGGELSNMALLTLLRRMGRVNVTTHGFRSTFRDWAAEVTNYPNELAEMALAHAIDDEAEAAYRRGDLFEKRRAMMEDWAAFCGRAGRPENVVPIRAA
jgi:integrase